MRLSAEQERAIAHEEGPALVLAVPGSGKTTVLLHRAKRLIEAGVRPRGVWTLSFNRSAVKMMRERFFRLAPDMPRPSFATIHGLSYQVIRRYGELRQRQVRVLEGEPGGTFRLARDVAMDRLGVRPSDRDLDGFFAILGVLKNQGLPLESYQQVAERPFVDFLVLAEGYEEAKRAFRLVDYDDMVPMALRILQEDAYLRRQFRHSIDFLQMDEGQDTSRMQMDLARYLVPEGNLFVVADDDQSIYGFRGADSQVLAEWRDANDQLQMYYLTTNFRSGAPIFSAAGGLIERNSLRMAKPMRTFQRSGKPVRLVEVEDAKAQGELLVSLAQEDKPGQLAVLYRHHSSAALLVEALEAADIPFGIEPLHLFLQSHWLVEDLQAFYHLSQDMRDVQALQAVFYKMNGYLSREQMRWLAQEPVADSVFQTLLAFPGLPDYYQRHLWRLERAFRLLHQSSPARFLAILDESLGYGIYRARRGVQESVSAGSSQQVWRLLVTMADHVNRMDALFGRLAFIDLLLAQSKGETKAPVVLMSAHGAKGLEFERVFLADVAEGWFPGIQAHHPDGLEEERRLFYVAMTRAKEELVICYPHDLGKQSVFFNELLDG